MKVMFHGYRLENLSKFRSPLMGISIIMILLCHARMDGAQLPDIILSILSLGNWGVDIFLLLSGIGMYYSISKNYDDINWGVWIYTRLKRILVPYLIIETPFWLWYAISNGLGIGGYLYYISFASYWLENIGVWFLALLIPLYLFTPLLYKLFNTKYKYIFMCIAIFMVIFGSVYPIESNSDVIRTIQSCISRIPCYLVGLGIGEDVKNHRISSKIITYPFVIYVFCLFFNLSISKNWIWGIFITILLTIFLKRVPNSLISFFSYVGKHTLELYIGLDLSKNILIYFFDLSTIFWVLSIVGSIIVAILYNCIINQFKNLSY